MEKIFFESWESLVRTFLIGVLSYAGIVLMLRIIGNRTLSQLNAFDLIVTVALGSTLATVILNKNVPLADGALALALLIILQFVVSWLCVHSDKAKALFKTEPFLLFYQGHYLNDALKHHRVTKDEILQVMRAKGIGNLQDVDAVVLETNGKFSVIKKVSETGQSSLENVSFPKN